MLERPQQADNHQFAVAAAATAAAYEVPGTSMLNLQPMQPNLLPNANRQKAMPLPTLQESPLTTPGTSPQLTAAAAAAAAAAADAPQGPSLALHDMQLQAGLLQQQLGIFVQQQQQQQQCAVDLDHELSNSPATDTAASFSGGMIGSFEEDHSLADFLADGPEGSDVSEISRGSGGSSSAALIGASARSENSGSATSRQQPQRAESPPCSSRRDGRSFEFSRPHNMLGAVFDSSSPAQVGNARLLR
jgi:hypothetical protein